MKIFWGFEETISLKSPVVAIGSFDGVHLGHCQVLCYLCNCAQQCAGESVVVTFDPHPQEVLRPNSDFFKINTLQKNLELIEKQGVDAVVVIPFTKEFSELSYSDFIERYIVQKLHASTLVMGPNHALGHNREGHRDAIEQLCEKCGVSVVELPELLCHEVAVHSAQIRKLITAGDTHQVDELLGYHYEKQ